MEDLTINADVIAQQLDDLDARLALMQSNPKRSIQDLQARLDKAQEAYDETSSDLSTTYTSNDSSLARTFINANNGFVLSDFEEGAKAARIAETAFGQQREEGSRIPNWP